MHFKTVAFDWEKLKKVNSSICEKCDNKNISESKELDALIGACNELVYLQFELEMKLDKQKKFPYLICSEYIDMRFNPFSGIGMEIKIGNNKIKDLIQQASEYLIKFVDNLKNKNEYNEIQNELNSIIEILK